MFLFVLLLRVSIYWLDFILKQNIYVDNYKNKYKRIIIIDTVVNQYFNM